METKTQSEQLDNPEQKTVHAEPEAPPKSTWSSSKTILIAVVISVITIGTLLVLRDQIDSSRKEATVAGHNVVVLDKTAVGGIGADIDRMMIDKIPNQTGEMLGAIEYSIGNLLERISQWFDALGADHASMNREISGLVNAVSAIQESVAELRKSNEELKQRIDGAQTRLQAIARDLRGLTIAAKEQTAKQQKQAVAKPPFNIDAIDLWDDTVYVAISQNGRVIFLREGEQRSGWSVAHIDRAKGQVAFRGPAGQDYSASLRR